MLDKNLVKFRFQKCINTYDDSAVIKKEMAAHLIDLVLCNCGRNFSNVFEFGAGTGFLSKNILHQISFLNYCANDIIEESEFCIKNIIDNAKFLSGDIEKIRIEETYDLILSNAVMQWIADIDELLIKMHNALNDGGYFAFTTFGEQNYKEIKDTTGVSLEYLKTETLKEKCNLGFEIVCFEENVQTLCFNTPLDVLKHIKNSGTNGIKPLNWTVSKLKHFEDYYKKCFGMNDKVTLTYNPVYVVLKKK